MEEHFLCSVLARQKLDVIDDQDVYLHVKIGEVLHVAIFDGIHELVHKLFRRHVEHKFFSRSIFYFVANGLHQVGFSQTYPSIYHQGVEGGDSRLACNRKSCRTSESVAIAFDVAYKSIIWIQVALGKQSCIQGLHFKWGLYLIGIWPTFLIGGNSLWK